MKLSCICFVAVAVLVLGCGKGSIVPAAQAQTVSVQSKPEWGWKSLDNTQTDYTYVGIPGYIICQQKSEALQFSGQLVYVAAGKDKVFIRPTFQAPAQNPAYTLELGIDQSVIVGSYFTFNDIKNYYSIRVTLIKLDDDGMATFSVARVPPRSETEAKK